MRNFIGRQNDIERFEKLWKQTKTQIVSLYGRRRVGKSELIRHVSLNKKALLFEALEDEDTPTQIKHFLFQLSEYYQEPHLKDLNYQNWAPVFTLLSKKMEQEKDLLLFFDELPWMASGRTHLISQLKFFWDKYWKYHPHLLFIVCGSVTSWMVKNVIRSKALYGRLSDSFLLAPLKPEEVSEFIGKKRGQKEVLEYLLCFGGIPRYLEEFDFNQSIQINIEKKCFQKSGFFFGEAEKIFYSQFQEAQLYRQIVKKLQKQTLSLEEIATTLNISSGGGLKQYIDNLIDSGILASLYPIRDFKVSRTPVYFLSDEFLYFHQTFMVNAKDEITHSERGASFEKLTAGKWAGFLGYAFEKFCLKHRYRIADTLGFGPKVIGCGPLCFRKQGESGKGYQYDLVFIRKDNVVTFCEMKYRQEPMGTEVIRDMEEKIKRTALPRGWSYEKVLITNQSPSKELEKSGYFNHILTAETLIHTS